MKKPWHGLGVEWPATPSTKLDVTESELLRRGIISVQNDIDDIDEEMEELRQRKAELYGKLADAKARVNELEKTDQKPYR